MPTIPTVFRSIESGDYRTTTFKAFKQYNVTSDGGGYSLFGSQHQKYTPPIGAAVASDDPTNADGTNQYMVWNHIDHRYYRYPYDAARTMEHFNRRTVEKFLFLTASIFSIPYFQLGEKIKPGTVTITDQAYNLYDDGQGNLKDSTIDSGSFADKRKLVGYWTFNNEFRKKDNNYGNVSGSLKIISNTSTLEIESLMTNIDLEPGVRLTSTAASSGIEGGFDGVTSYIKTPNHKEFNPGACDDYAWSFWINAPISQSNQSTNYNSLIRKDAVFDDDYYDNKDKLIKKREQIIAISKYPYHIAIKNNQTDVLTNGKVRFTVSGEDKAVTITSTTQCTGSHHIVAQRSGSEMQLWIDGTKEDSSTLGTGPTKNDRKIMFGAKQPNSAFARYSGSMAEIRYYKYGLSTDQISSLADADYTSCGAYQTSTAGNIFYKNGHIVISSPIPKYTGALHSGAFSIGYKGVHTIYENEVLVRVPKDTCNVSMNPSATYTPPAGKVSSQDCLAQNGPGEMILPGFISGSMSPYITTVGLYNDKSQLLAIGKLAQPIQKRDDVDMNFIVRWDY